MLKPTKAIENQIKNKALDLLPNLNSMLFLLIEERLPSTYNFGLGMISFTPMVLLHSVQARTHRPTPLILTMQKFGQQRHRLSVEWARGDCGVRHWEGEGVMRPTNTKPTKTLFVINFDPFTTKIRYLERHFEPYGKLLHVRIRRNFAFVQYETQEGATKALDCTHMSKLMDHVILVEYAIREEDDRNSQQESPGRRGGYGKWVSPTYDQSISPIYGKQGRRPNIDS